MQEQLDEIIEAVVSFKRSSITPAFFKWRDKLYKINKVHLVHTSREGSQMLYHFSVSDNANYFQLTFNPYNLTWRITALYNEG